MAYHVTLQQYDGPLDLLLQLVTRAQIDIREIFIADITEQFLAFMAQMDRDMERAGEFLEMAARLLEIKSRRLLPNAEKDEELALMGEELLRQLEEYRRYKFVSEELRQREAQGQDYFYRLPQELPQGELVFANAEPMALYTAFLRLMERAGRAEPPVAETTQVQRETFTVQQAMLRIRTRLLQAPRVLFSSLLAQPLRREELITTFMAVLELMKLGQVTARQEGLYADFYLLPPAQNEEKQDA